MSFSVISNSAGTDSTTFSVDVLTKPEVLGSKQLEELVKVSGDLVTLTCDVTGVPFPDISWTKDGNPLSSQPDSIRVSPDGRHLTLIDIGYQFEGDYVCHVENKAGRTRKIFK